MGKDLRHNYYVDINFPENGTVKDLSTLLSKSKYGLTQNPRLTNSKLGEYRISPVSLVVFDSWAESRLQYPHGLEYKDNALVIAIILPPHDGVAGIIAQHLFST
jgi:hypothetical protein